jgi:hypothetical protein
LLKKYLIQNSIELLGIICNMSISRSNIMLRKKAEAIVAKYLSLLRLSPGKYLYQFFVDTLHSERGCKYPQIAGCCENVYETYYEIVDNC